MTHRTIFLLVFCSGFSALQGCLSSSTGFESIRIFLDSNADAIVLEGEAGSKLLVSPRLQGRIMTAKVGSVESTGLVPQKTIKEGESHAHFNNFGGIDRFWIGPEAGQYGVYFPPGAKELTRDNWQVPASFDTGAFTVLEKKERSVQLHKEIGVTNLRGIQFKATVTREIALIPSAALGTELGIELPAGVSYLGCYSDNRLTNTGDDWDPKTGLVGIWILGMFNASDQSAVIAPFKSTAGGKPPYSDAAYFGKVAEDRLKVIGQSVIFRGDARKVGKFGLSQERTTGLAGAFDFGRNLLTVVRFSVPQTMERYGNSTWNVTQEDPYSGDVFQSYNNGDGENPGGVAADAFFELESASPVRPLRKGESISHRHATYHFQGSRKELDKLASKILGVSLDKVQAAMWPAGS